MTSTIKPEPGREWLPWVLAGTLIGLWLFLPPGVISLGSLTLRSFDVVRWVPFAIAICICPRPLFHWHWLDIPIAICCLCPLIAGVLNQLDLTASARWSIKEFSDFWIPYAIGRFYLTIQSSRKILAWCVILGAILYIPPTIYEIYNGPTLAKWATGQEFGGIMRGAERGDTFKPSVFLSSGFVLTMFYVWAALVALHYAVRTFWIWFMPPMEWDRPIPKTNTWLLQGILSGVFIGIVMFCKSLGSIILMTIGAVVILMARSRVAGVAMATLCLIPPVYIGLRSTGIASSDRIHSLIQTIAPEVRAGSFRYRLEAEELVFATMEKQYWWGYGDWGRWINFIPDGFSARVMDGFWLHYWTRTGMVSLILWWIVAAFPLLIIASYSIKQGWVVNQQLEFVYAVYIAIILVDSLFNFAVDAQVMMCVGVITTWAKELKAKNES